MTQGNIEHFTGVAQIPLGIAGPLLVHGKHAKGEFYVPLATSEGTLVASYNRGMKVIHESGGVKCAVVGDNMQRAPVFIFEDAASGRRFADWLVSRMDDIKAVCAESDPFVTLKYVDYYLANKFAFTRFNYTTGDAAGMNMVGKATFAACNWILENCQDVEIQHFYLESNFATDKKASMINMMRSRGKRVTAEIVVQRDVLREIMDADTESIYQHSQVANVGSMLSGANNNGCHAANAITAIFIATGQDVANVVRVLGRAGLYGADAGEGPLHVDHAAVADRRHLRRRHRAAHPARGPGDHGLRRRRQGDEVRRDRRRHGARRRDLAGGRHLLARLGVEPRSAGPQRPDETPGLICSEPQAAPRPPGDRSRSRCRGAMHHAVDSARLAMSASASTVAPIAMGTTGKSL